MASAANRADERTAAPTPAGGKSAPELRDLIDTMRGRVEATGKVLGALGTAAATTFGVATLDDALPVPDGRWWVAVLAIALLVAGMAGVLVIALRLSGVSRPLLMRTDLRAMREDGEISADERRLVEPLYEDVARLNGASSLATYERRAASVRRAARWADDDEERRRRLALADEIGEDIKLTLGRGAVIVIRERTTQAFTGGWAKVAFVMIVLGFVGFTMAAKQIDGSRPAQQVVLARACAEARSAGATATELADVDGCSTSADSDPPDAVAAARACGEARAAGATPGELRDTTCATHLMRGSVMVTVDDDEDGDGNPRTQGRPKRGVAKVRRVIVATIGSPAFGNLVQLGSALAMPFLGGG